MLNKAALWQRFYNNWESQSVDLNQGYTILMLIPGDLPVFLKIAMEVCATQDPTHLVETLVIPDQRPQGFSQLFESYQQSYSASPLRLVKLKPVEQLISRQQNNPHTNCWLQMVRGIEATRTTHALWHDADLFITSPDFLKTHYEACASQNLACLGLNKPWDSWYEEQGITHLTSTWELMMNVDWVKQFKPWEHRGHDGVVAGKPHTFDITFSPQCQTAPDKIKRHPKVEGFVHFNYVISTYRRFFQRSLPTYEDEYFRILLIRLLIEAFDQSDWRYDIPPLEELVKGITDPTRRATYVQEETRQHYPEFRTKLQQLLEMKQLKDQQVSIISDGIRPFDQAFGFAGKVPVLQGAEF